MVCNCITCLYNKRVRRRVRQLASGELSCAGFNALCDKRKANVKIELNQASRDTM